MIRELIPAIQATALHPLLKVEENGESSLVLALSWANTPPGRLCHAVAWATLYGTQDSHYGDSVADAVQILRSLTPDELITVQTYAPAAVREFVILNLDKS